MNGEAPVRCAPLCRARFRRVRFRPVRCRRARSRCAQSWIARCRSAGSQPARSWGDQCPCARYPRDQLRVMVSSPRVVPPPRTVIPANDGGHGGETMGAGAARRHTPRHSCACGSPLVQRWGYSRNGEADSGRSGQARSAATPTVIPARAGTGSRNDGDRTATLRQWIPACAGMTIMARRLVQPCPARRSSLPVPRARTMARGFARPYAPRRSWRLAQSARPMAWALARP